MPTEYLPPLNRRDPGTIEAWAFEELVFERIARQLRVVGDGLAWRRFGYDRRIIFVLFPESVTRTNVRKGWTRT